MVLSVFKASALSVDEVNSLICLHTLYDFQLEFPEVAAAWRGKFDPEQEQVMQKVYKDVRFCRHNVDLNTKSCLEEKMMKYDPKILKRKPFTESFIDEPELYLFEYIYRLLKRDQKLFEAKKNLMSPNQKKLFERAHGDFCSCGYDDFKRLDCVKQKMKNYESWEIPAYEYFKKLDYT